MNTTPITGDHDQIAEDRPEPEPTWAEIDLASVIIGKTLVEYLCADNGDEFTDHRWQTKRENPCYPRTSVNRWSDADPHHDTDLDAIGSASMHLLPSERFTDGEIELHAANLHAQAAITKIKLRK